MTWASMPLGSAPNRRITRSAKALVRRFISCGFTVTSRDCLFNHQSSIINQKSSIRVEPVQDDGGVVTTADIGRLAWCDAVSAILIAATSDEFAQALGPLRLDFQHVEGAGNAITRLQVRDSGAGFAETAIGTLTFVECPQHFVSMIDLAAQTQHRANGAAGFTR